MLKKHNHIAYNIYKIILYYQAKKLIYITNYNNLNYINLSLSSQHVVGGCKSLNDKKSLIYHYDSTKFKNLKKKFKIIYFFNNFLNSYNFALYSTDLKTLNMFKSSIWIDREVFDMFGLDKNIYLADTRRLLIDYSTPRGVLL